MKKLSLFSIFLFLSTFIFLNNAESQILSRNIIDLRSRIADHKWFFHPGDSPVVEQGKNAEKGEVTVYADNSEELDEGSKEIRFSWAEKRLRDKNGWIKNMEIQRAWTRHYDESEKKYPFSKFKEYIRDYHGYGWYRTTFTVTEDDLTGKFKSRDLVIELGKIGQADAVYLNGRYIGGRGLKPDTAPGTILDDKDLFYDMTRFYRLPRDLVTFNKKNVLAVRVFAKYNIAPGLSHGKYIIASSNKIDRTKFWDDFKKIIVISLTILLGIFYIYWHFVFRGEDKSGIYFAFTAFAMAVNTFAQSQIIYSIWSNAIWIKKLEFISMIAFVHLLVIFMVRFVGIRTKFIRIVNSFWALLGIAAIAAVIAIPALGDLRRFMFGWGVLPVVLFIYIVFILVRGRKIPSLPLMAIGFVGMSLMLVNEALVGMQFRWVMWELSLKDYAFAFFSLMAAASIVSNLKKSKELIEQQQVEKDRLAKFFSPGVIKEILGGEVSLGGSEKPIATLFADIVGFTSFSEKQSPAKVLERLNEMFTKLSGVIIEYDATLDKYIGDCIMAFWGAPKATDRDAYNAVLCALTMQKVCEEMMAELPEGEPPFRLRIGINYGPAIAGYIGSSERMDYSVIGDAVNIASRIESNGIPGRVAISESVFAAAGGDEYIRYSETKEITVKGKAEPLRIYIVDEVLERK